MRKKLFFLDLEKTATNLSKKDNFHLLQAKLSSEFACLFVLFSLSQQYIGRSVGGERKFADGMHCRRVRPPPEKKCDLGKTQNCI